MVKKTHQRRFISVRPKADTAFPGIFPFAVCLGGHSCKGETQEELEACRDCCLHPRWMEAFLWTDIPLIPAGGSWKPFLEPPNLLIPQITPVPIP